MITTAKLDDMQRSFIQLLLRSKDVGEGWRKVSTTLEKAVVEQVARNPELFEIGERDIGTNKLLIRLSERGKVVADYL